MSAATDLQKCPLTRPANEVCEGGTVSLFHGLKMAGGGKGVDGPFLGGLRRAYESSRFLPEGRVLGERIRKQFLKILDDSTVNSALGNLGKERDCIFETSVVLRARETLVEVCDGVPSDATWRTPSSPIFGKLVKLVATAMGDWDMEVCNWLTGQGCPIGINKVINRCDVFPPTTEGEVPLELGNWAEIVHFLECDDRPRNYVSADSNWEITQRLFEGEREKGFCRIFPDQAALKKELGNQECVVSKVALAEKDGVDGDGNKRYRLLVDGKQSNVNRLITVDERVQLPRMKDVIDDWREMSRVSRFATDAGLFCVLDFRDAFKLFPVAKEELPFNVCCCRTGSSLNYILYDVLQFGFRSSPLLWCRGAALFSRQGQLVLSPSGKEGRISTYVDDPLISVVAEEIRERMRLICLPLLLWSAFNLPFSCRKGQVGNCVQWIGRKIELMGEYVRVSVPVRKLEEVLFRIRECRAVKFIEVTALRASCGRLCWVAQVISQLTPFISPLWRAINMADIKGLKVVRLPSVTVSRSRTIKDLEISIAQDSTKRLGDLVDANLHLWLRG